MSCVEAKASSNDMYKKTGGQVLTSDFIFIHIITTKAPRMQVSWLVNVCRCFLLRPREAAREQVCVKTCMSFLNVCACEYMYNRALGTSKTEYLSLCMYMCAYQYIRIYRHSAIRKHC